MGRWRSFLIEFLRPPHGSRNDQRQQRDKNKGAVCGRAFVVLMRESLPVFDRDLVHPNGVVGH
jgi:hypothetical protein